ncbi:PREDICTED: putative disease resistance protein RGA4 [Erythranthe guttata]|uniref:putative disease resistance protein RGA4 n=1 Tax=Erythranthe guttata TaxID=4155 RepID=UPI00064DF0F3|nr:PREDICTED: putative disease resistance protein RGA4 [Erythranthe guttata]|eukprot:XP_012847489.1 PREDICTED: putative disease resistance protein RGA4 [Erythranthe guttata]
MSNSTLEKLVDVHISSCKNFLHLPQLGELPHLKYLWVIAVEEVEYIMEDPLISELRIEDCSSLKVVSSSLKNLKKLKCTSSNLALLSNLENLTKLDVYFESTSVETKCAVTTETLRSLTNLKILNICNADELSLPEQGLRALKSLANLYIVNCNSLPRVWFVHFTALEKLGIYGCPEVVELPQEIKNLNNSLKTVILSDLPNMFGFDFWQEKAIQEQNCMLTKQIKDKEQEVTAQPPPPQWPDHHNRGGPSAPPVMPPPFQFLMTPQFPCLNIGGDEYEGEAMEGRRNDQLDLTLDSFYSCNLGCFATS